MNASLNDSVFLKACKGLRPERTPIWLMRQAGRYQPEYIALKEKYSFLDLCSKPELIAEVTLIPFSYAPFDAAIIFSDITIVLRALGVDFTIEEKVGPVMKDPIEKVSDLAKLERRDCAEALSYVFEGIKLVKPALKVPLIGFAAAPFTLASYLMSGKAGRDKANARKFIFSEPEAWNSLMTTIVDVTIDYLGQQAKAGVDALQVFDSWVGELDPVTYEAAVMPHMCRLFEALSKHNLPTIHFGTGTALLLSKMSKSGGDVIGVDWRPPFSFAKEQVGNKPLMGNLDPAAMLAPWPALKQQAEKVLVSAKDINSHIFNLGHGIMPQTPFENVQRLVEFVQSWKN